MSKIIITFLMVFVANSAFARGGGGGGGHASSGGHASAHATAHASEAQAAAKATAPAKTTVPSKTTTSSSWWNFWSPKPAPTVTPVRGPVNTSKQDCDPKKDPACSQGVKK